MLRSELWLTGAQGIGVDSTVLTVVVAMVVAVVVLYLGGLVTFYCAIYVILFFPRRVMWWISIHSIVYTREEQGQCKWEKDKKTGSTAQDTISPIYTQRVFFFKKKRQEKKSYHTRNNIPPSPPFHL